MYTTITIKTNKILRDEAKAVADKLGVPLTTIINGYLRTFIRERAFSVSLEPTPTRQKIRLWETISDEYKKTNRQSKRNKDRNYSDVNDLISHLKLE